MQLLFDSSRLVLFDSTLHSLCIFMSYDNEVSAVQLYFNPATVKMLSNLKVLVIAVLLKMVMKRRFSIIQVSFSCSY